MKKKSNVAILDLGSQTIKGSLSFFSLDGKMERFVFACEQSSSIEGALIKDKKKVSKAILNLIYKLERKANTGIDFVYIISNDSYSIAKVIKKELNFKKGRLIKAEDLEWLTKKITNSTISKNPNYKIIDTNIVAKYIDGVYFPFGDVEKQFAKKSVAIEISFVLSLKSYIKSIQDTIHLTGLDLCHIIPSFVSMGFFLSEEQKKTNTCVVDIGATTTTISFFQRGVLTKGRTFKMGGDDIKETVSRVTGISLQKAEERKKTATQIERNREIDKIVSVELKKFAIVIRDYLKTDEIYKTMSGGVIISGGVSCDQNIQEIFKIILKLPIYRTKTKMEGDKSQVDCGWGLMRGGVSCVMSEIANNISSENYITRLYRKIKEINKNIRNKIAL